jgi:hypothetical protein
VGVGGCDISPVPTPTSHVELDASGGHGGTPAGDPDSAESPDDQGADPDATAGGSSDAPASNPDVDDPHEFPCDAGAVEDADDDAAGCGEDAGDVDGP